MGFIHPFTRAGFVVDTNPHRADLEHLAATVSEIEAAHHQVGAACRRVERGPGLRHQLLPALLGDDRYLALAPLVRIADQATPSFELGRGFGIHWPALGPLEPDRFEFAGAHWCSSFRLWSDKHYVNLYDFGGCQPDFTQIARARTRNSSFNTSAAIVARPLAVLAIIIVPSALQAK